MSNLVDCFISIKRTSFDASLHTFQSIGRTIRTSMKSIRRMNKIKKIFDL